MDGFHLQYMDKRNSIFTNFHFVFFGKVQFITIKTKKPLRIFTKIIRLVGPLESGDTNVITCQRLTPTCEYRIPTSLKQCFQDYLKILQILFLSLNNKNIYSFLQNIFNDYFFLGGMGLMYFIHKIDQGFQQSNQPIVVKIEGTLEQSLQRLDRYCLTDLKATATVDLDHTPTHTTATRLYFQVIMKLFLLPEK